MITWEGRSCNGRHIESNSVGVIFYGEKGSLLIEEGNAYKIYGLDNKLIKEVKANRTVNAQDRMNPSQSLDALHIQNFFEGIKHGATLNAEIVGGYQSTLLAQLGNIALRSGTTLDIDPANGHILNNKKAQQFWKREYQKGWEPSV